MEDTHLSVPCCRSGELSTSVPSADRWDHIPVCESGNSQWLYISNLSIMGSSPYLCALEGKCKKFLNCLISYFTLVTLGKDVFGFSVCLCSFVCFVYLFVCHWNDCVSTETQNEDILNKRTNRQLQVSSQALLLIQSVYDELITIENKCLKTKDVFILENVVCWMQIQIEGVRIKIKILSSCISFFLRNRNVKVTSMLSCPYQHHTLWYQSFMSPQSFSPFPQLFTPLWSGCGQLHGCFG